MNYNNIVMWSKHWSLTNFLKTIDNNTNSNIVILGAEEFSMLGWENYPNQKKVNKHIKGKNVHFVAGHFGGNNNFWPKYGNLIVWKSFWPANTVYEFNKFNHSISNKDISIPFISMNNQPWQHRCLMMDTLAKHNLIDKGSISWNNLINDYDWKYWKQERLIIDKEYASTTAQYSTLPNDYNFSLVSLVNESTMETMFPTEKTYAPIYYKKPFLVFSVQNYHKMLSEEFGFEMYDELFDYSFDSESNQEKRADMIAIQIRNLVNQNYNDLYKKVAQKVERNYNKLISISLDKSRVPKIVLECGAYKKLIEVMK